MHLLTGTFTTSTADVESAVRAAIEQTIVHPLCRQKHGMQEECEAIAKHRKRSIALNGGTPDNMITMKGRANRAKHCRHSGYGNRSGQG